ncbi:MAG: hypothetical protein MHM6MM_003226 [Cercozoa sp. M6MM]
MPPKRKPRARVKPRAMGESEVQIDHSLRVIEPTKIYTEHDLLCVPRVAQPRAFDDAAVFALTHVVENHPRSGFCVSRRSALDRLQEPSATALHTSSGTGVSTAPLFSSMVSDTCFEASEVPLELLTTVDDSRVQSHVAERRLEHEEKIQRHLDREKRRAQKSAARKSREARKRLRERDEDEEEDETVMGDISVETEDYLVGADEEELGGDYLAMNSADEGDIDAFGEE